jgi:hypothetical protein
MSDDDGVAPRRNHGCDRLTVERVSGYRLFSVQDLFVFCLVLGSSAASSADRSGHQRFAERRLRRIVANFFHEYFLQNAGIPGLGVVAGE